MELAAGQRWRYRAAEGCETSRLVVGAIVTFEGGERIICCSVENAAHVEPDGSVTFAPLVFLPMSDTAWRATATEFDGSGEPHPAFAAALSQWGDDPAGLSAFTVAYDGFLDRTIARQMASIVESAA